VDVPSGTVRDNIMPLPYKEPSQTLLSLLNQITDEGRRLGAIADMKISDMSAQAPVGTTLALLERTLKTMSAVQARVHASLRMEFKLLKAIIRDDTPTSYPYTPNGGNRQVKQADYDIVEVIPVSDPNAATMAQRIMQYQAAIQLAQGAPQIYNLPKLHRQMLEVLGIKNAEDLVPVEDDQKPRDPVSENMGFLTGQPAKAFIYQDHEAHMATHTALMQDPKIMQIIGQNPMAQQMQGAIMAHIAEHLSFAYRSQIEDQLGVPLPPPNMELPPQLETEMSRVIAEAAKQLQGVNKQQSQQQQAQQQAQDPMIQLQQATVQVQAQEVQRKTQDDERNFQIAQQKLQLEQMKIQLEAKKEEARLKSQERQNTVRVAAQNQQNDKKLRVDMIKSNQPKQQFKP
jgi:hypothetical protein